MLRISNSLKKSLQIKLFFINLFKNLQGLKFIAETINIFYNNIVTEYFVKLNYNKNIIIYYQKKIY